MPKLAGVHHFDAVRAFQKGEYGIIRRSKHIMADGTRKLVIPRQNTVNAITMGGIIRDAGLTIAGFRGLL